MLSKNLGILGTVAALMFNGCASQPDSGLRADDETLPDDENVDDASGASSGPGCPDLNPDDPDRRRCLVASGFSTSSEDWKVLDIEYGAPSGINYDSPIGEYTPDFISPGGNPGGHLLMGDPTEHVFYFCAPMTFLGDQSSAYGGQLRFDLKLAQIVSPYDDADLVLVSDTAVLLRRPSLELSTGWTTYNVDLVETSGWVIESLDGDPASTTTFVEALTSLRQLCIRGEYGAAIEEVVLLDNVALLAQE